MNDSFIFGSTIILALVTYGLTAAIALVVAGLIRLIGRAVKMGSTKSKSEQN